MSAAGDGPGRYYVVELTTLDGSTVPPLRPERLVLKESVLGGWNGFARVQGGEQASIIEAFWNVSNRHFHPGLPITVRVMSVGEDDADSRGSLVRSWPSVVTKVGSSTSPKDGRAFSHIYFQDTVGYLSARHVWGVFRDCSLAEAVGGAISLAADGGGQPVLSPLTEGLPAVDIAQVLRPALGSFPYIVAAGSSLGVLLARLFRRLGVRMEMRGFDERIEVTLKDGPPDGFQVNVTLGDSASAHTGVVLDRNVEARHATRDTVLDNPSMGATMRVLQKGAVGHVVTSAGTDFNEAVFRANFAADHDYVTGVGVELLTGQPDIAPGGRVQFDRWLFDENEMLALEPPGQPGVGRVRDGAHWQVGSVMHLLEAGAYNNKANLWRDGVAWRQRPVNGESVTMLTGVVNDGSSDPGEVVSRDRLGRIPVTLQADYSEGGGLPGLPLPVADPIAGGRHGFLPQHRQGDRCRLAVSSPLDMEVVGFLYDDDRAVAGAVGAGSGIVVDHDGNEWSGMLFEPPANDS